MMILNIIQMVLRVVELVFAAIVAGVLGSYLDDLAASEVNDQGRAIYSIVVAGLSMLLALIWLVPFTKGFFSWPADVFVSILWWVAFGLLVDQIGDSCGYVFNWENIEVREEDMCGRWKATIAFSFLSALVWLASAVVGFLIHRKAKKEHAGHHTTTRRRWYHRRSRV